jgi:hypothetical protein
MNSPSKPVPQKDSPQEGRAARLAAALRENLKRRKAQAHAKGRQKERAATPADAAPAKAR